MTGRRSWLLWLWLGYLLFIFYGASLPFHVDWRHASRKWQQLIAGPLGADDLLLPDILSNVLLFVPFGVLLGAYWRESRSSSLAVVRQVVYTFLAGAGFSVLFELWQLFLPSRTTSALDVMANSLGALSGAVLAVALSAAVEVIGETRAQSLLARYPLTLFLFMVLLVQCIGRLLPLDLSIDIGDLKDNLKRANLQPFGSLTLLGRATAPFSPSQFLERLWLFALVGWLFGTCAHWEWKARAFRALGLWLAMISFLIAVELLQLIVRSRTFDVNGTLSCLAGFVLGSWAFRAWLLFKQRRGRASAALAQALRFLFVPYLVLLVLAELSPFDLSFAPATIAARWKAVEFLPFTAYYSNTSLWSLQDLLETVILAVPAGLWVAWRLQDQPVWRVAARALTGGLAMGAILEASQLLTQSRFPGITDVISFGIGSMVGSGCVLAWRGTVSRTDLETGSLGGTG